VFGMVGGVEDKAAWGSRSVEMFEKVEQVGEGTYGQVYKARNKDTGELVALKRVRMDNEREGFPITAIREIKILKVLNHKNVVRLKEIVTSKGSDYNQGKGSIYMVMEFCDHDLTGLTDAGQRFTVPQIKCYMKQLLEGLAYCHAQKVLHRDIKGSNLLISNDGFLKLADFGLARPYDTDQQRPYTNRVITLWYRPPELLLGATMYGPAIDMWSAGCIFAELLTRKPILPGKNEFEQIDLIFKLFGTPDEATWAGCKHLQYYDMIISQSARKYACKFDDKFASLEPTAKSLLRKLLAMDPSQRISADAALDDEYFWSDPPPATPEQLPHYPPSHEFTAKKRRQATQQQQQQNVMHQQHQQHQQHPQHPQHQQHQHQPHQHHQSAMLQQPQQLPHPHSHSHPHAVVPPYHNQGPCAQYPQAMNSFAPPSYAMHYPPHPTLSRSGIISGSGTTPQQIGFQSSKRLRSDSGQASNRFFDSTATNGGPPRGSHSSGQAQQHGGPAAYCSVAKTQGTSSGGYPAGGWPR